MKEILLDSPEGKIKDIILNLNTGETGTTSVMTEKINLNLKAIIVSSGIASIDIEINSELGYTLYFEQAHRGTHYIPVMVGAISPNAHRVNLNSDNFYLNEKLLITVRGSLKKPVKIILRGE